MVKIAFERESPKSVEDLKARPSIKIRSSRLAGGKTMWDIGCVGASILFFVIAIGYATGCDRLGAKEMQR
jgi:hypothetical protein